MQKSVVWSEPSLQVCTMFPRISRLITFVELCALCLIINNSHASRQQVRDKASSECNKDLLDRSFVTQCGLSNCEPLLDSAKTSEWPSSKDEVIQIVSSRDEDQRFRVIVHKAFDTTEFYYEESHVNGTIFVEPNIKYQRILGFGTTLTDASCKNIDDLPEEIRSKLVNDYFGTESGIGLNLIKVPIGSTKYSYTNYVLDQPDAQQVELSPYDIDQRIPIIKDAIKAAGKLGNRVKVLASSATAPSEYKDNNKLIHGGYLRQDGIKGYADYLVGFIKAYKTYDLNIWSLILSDSPLSIAEYGNSSDSLDYCSMAMKPSDTIRLIKAINEQQVSQPDLAKFRMLLLGDSRAFVPLWADAILQRPEIANKVAGLAYKCEDSTRFASYDNLMYFTKRHTNKYLLATQGSINRPVKLGNWQYAENYATEMVKNLEFGSVGWIDFNMALNLEGGPCLNDKFKADAAVVINTKMGVYYRNPVFYAIGHLSRYVKPGSIRVKINFISSAHMFAHQYIAFVTPDNYLIVLVMNNNIGPMPINIGIDKNTKVEALLATKSFNTFIFRL